MLRHQAPQEKACICKKHWVPIIDFHSLYTKLTILNPHRVLGPPLQACQEGFLGNCFDVLLSISNIPRGVKPCTGHILEMMAMAGSFSSNE